VAALVCIGFVPDHPTIGIIWIMFGFIISQIWPEGFGRIAGRPANISSTSQAQAIALFNP
jgi:hypothetical protein